MATKNEAPPPAPAGDPPSPKKKRGKLIVVIVAALVLVIGVAGAAVLLLGKNHDAEDAEASADDKPRKKKGDKAAHRPAYLSLEPFTVNLVSEGVDQYLQLALTLDMEEETMVEQAKVYTPKLRNDIMLMLSAKKPSEIISREGKAALALELKNQINGILDPESKGKKDAAGPVKEVLFTSLIIQ